MMFGPRSEIDAIQIAQLSKMVSTHRRSFLQRVSHRFQENFFGKPLKQKIQFFAFCGKWAFEKARQVFGKADALLKVRLNPRIREIETGSADDPVLRVAAYGFGGIGDLLGHVTFLQKFQLEHGPMSIDFFCHFYHRKAAAAEFAFRGTRIRNVFAHTWFDHLKNRYDLVIMIQHMVHYEVINAQRLCELQPRLANAISEATERFEEHRKFFDLQPLLDGLLGRLMTYQGRNRESTPGYFGNLTMENDEQLFLSPDADAYDVLTRIGLNGGGYITIHDGYDNATRTTNSEHRATKQWPVNHWVEFVRLFKERRPGIKVVQLGASNSKPITGVDIELVGKTSLHETAWIIKHAMTHVDGESGLVRMARALHVKCVVLFGPTDHKYFGFSANTNIVAECNGCWWVKPDWLSHCVRGLEQPECMHSLLPARVISEVEKIVVDNKKYGVTASAVSLYDADGLRTSRSDMLADIFTRTGLPPVPISAHAKSPESGAYIYASKQWEYLYAFSAIEGIRVQGLKVADLGGSRGAFAPYLASLGCKIDIFDIDYLWDHGGDLDVEHRFIRWARKMGANPTFASIFNIPAEDDTYDVVVSISVMEHLRYKQYALKEALRILKPEGLLVLTFDFALDASRNEDELRKEILTPARLSDLLAYIGANPVMVSDDAIVRSIDHIHRDGVLGIPDGMTVGGILFRKAMEPGRPNA